MFLAQVLLCLSFLLILGSSKPLHRTSERRQEPTLPPCGEIIAWVKNDYTYFDAHFVYECLRSVQFIPDVASRFLRYYNTTLQFHAPLDTLKSPPAGYQQPAVDLVRGLRAIQGKIDSGQYTNQYQFEADVHRLIAQAHDPHAQLDGGILAAFSFASPYGIVSASVDGKEVPGVYIDRDVVYSQIEGWVPSPIVKINGQDPVEYLMRYAEANAASYLEPHAEWNSLMESPVADVLGAWSTFQQGTVYPGGETDAQLIVELKNGTVVEDTWSAIYQEAYDTGPLTTAGDFYNYFVLGRLPVGWKNAGKWWPDRSLDDTPEVESVNPFAARCVDGDDDEGPIVERCKRSYAAYPREPAVIQGDLDDTYDELLTGYILEDISAGVLSLPRFYSTDAGEYDTFRTAIQDFISEAQKKKVKRIVIDVQQNSGGSSLRAYDTFKLFFPQLEPYGASRTRMHELASVLGSAYTKAFKENRLDDYYIANEWVISSRIHADKNAKFDSWDEYFTGKAGYSEPQRYNLSDLEFDLAAFPAIPWGYDPEIEDENSGQPFAADDIVILTDGLCGSACSLFVEFMSHQAGARTIAVGGRPKTGPMQAVSGSRGAAAYSADAIDDDMRQVNETLHDLNAFARFPDRTDTGMWINHAGITIRNQVREKDDTPLHFQFQAADCRIFFTLKNVYNVTQLWHDAVKATWDDSRLCVEGSTGYPSLRNIDSEKPPPSPNNKTQAVKFDSNPQPLQSKNLTFEIHNGPDWEDREPLTYEQCNQIDETTNTPAVKCMYMDVSCPLKTNNKKSYTVTVPISRSRCETSTNVDGCRGAGSCAKFTQVASKAHTNGNSNAVPYVGYCENKDPPAKQKWCVSDIAAKTAYAGYSLSSAFKCNKKGYKPKEKKFTQIECKQRMRIFETQTFAVWEKTGKNPAGDDVGTCLAYTCKAPTTAELAKKTDSVVYIWPSVVSAAIMKGIGG